MFNGLEQMLIEPIIAYRPVEPLHIRMKIIFYLRTTITSKALLKCVHNILPYEEKRY